MTTNRTFAKSNKQHFHNQKKIKGLEAFMAAGHSGISTCENPISYPVKNVAAGYDFQGGLIHSETLQLVKEAILLRSKKESQVLPHLDEGSLQKNQLRLIDGTFLYGGILLNNFGHFLLESISRLWAYDLFRKFDLHILFYAPWGISAYREKNNYMHQVLKGFDIPLKRVVFLTEIVQLKSVIIPEQKYGFEKSRTPDQTFVKFIKSFRSPDHLPKATRNADNVYVSRSRLPFSQGRPLGEAVFEKYLQSNGYLVIHPEKLNLYEQLTIYKRAKKIIFCDGGATYATILLPDLIAEVAIVARRRDYRWNYKELTEHFVGYKKPVVWIDEVIAQYQYGLETWDAAGEIDWHKVSLVLKRENFVDSVFEQSYAREYADVKRKELQQYIQSIHSNPLFLDYMEKLSEVHPLLPTSF